MRVCEPVRKAAQGAVRLVWEVGQLAGRYREGLRRRRELDPEVEAVLGDAQGRLQALHEYAEGYLKALEQGRRQRARALQRRGINGRRRTNGRTD